MIKKIILAILIFMPLCVSDIFAENSGRWIPIGGAHSNSYRFIDGSTINYDSENGEFIYWVKEVNSKGEIRDISKIKASPKNKTCLQVYTKIYWSKKLDEELNRIRNRNLMLILPQSDIEQEVNFLCEKYHKPYVWGHKEHSWVKAVINTNEYFDDTWSVCADTFLKNETTNEYIMFAKVDTFAKNENYSYTLPSFFIVNIKKGYFKWPGGETDSLLIPESNNELFFSVSKKIITATPENAYPLSKIKGSEFIKLGE